MTIAILILVILLFVWVTMMAASVKGFIDEAKAEVIRVMDHNTKEALEMIFCRISMPFPK